MIDVHFEWDYSPVPDPVRFVKDLDRKKITISPSTFYLPTTFGYGISRGSLATLSRIYGISIGPMESLRTIRMARSASIFRNLGYAAAFASSPITASLLLASVAGVGYVSTIGLHSAYSSGSGSGMSLPVTSETLSYFGR